MLLAQDRAATSSLRSRSRSTYSRELLGLLCPGVKYYDMPSVEYGDMFESDNYDMPDMLEDELYDFEDGTLLASCLSLTRVHEPSVQGVGREDSSSYRHC